MRQIAVTDKKLRGIPRRLRALAKWADAFRGLAVPRSPEGELFRNWKIPVHCALVQGRQSTREMQGFCMAQLLLAARHLVEARRPGEGYERVMCLMVWPWLHQSEVAVYYDADYHRGLAGNGNALAPRRLSMELGFEIPAGFVEHSVDVTQPDDAVRVEWWAIGEPLR
jgi:hypothetical protein